METSQLSIPSLLFTFIFLLLLFKILWNSRKSRAHKLPPGPWNLPIVGSMHHLAGELLHRRLHRLAMTFGPILRFKLGEINFISITSPELAREILKTHDKIFACRPPLMSSTYILYNNSSLVFSPCGKYWSELRKLCAMNLFTNKRIKGFGQIRQEASRNLVERIRAAEGTLPVSMSELFLEVAYLTIAKAAFGKDGSSVHQKSFFTACKEFFKLAGGFHLQEFFPSLGFLGDFTGLKARMKGIHKLFDAIMNEVIEMHQSRTVNEGDPDEDLLDVMLRLQREGALDIPLNMDSIKAVVLDLFLGGTETTAIIWEWIMTELIRHPDIMKKAQLEVRNAVNGKTIVEESDVHTLPYLNMIIKESLRLHPPGPFIVPRYCQETCEVAGYTIPVGYRVIINAWSIMRNPKSWDEPESFRPERFEGNPFDIGVTNFDFLPFGGGRRICPGISFGITSLTNVLANILYHFDWKLPEGKKPEELDSDEILGLSLTRKNELWLVGTPYK
ncbi:Premnaspirodiene oxygenase [Apostasia shenzhenica]|uniref:Premnaspirodiene oxygenase n=1 Tax=Apostasia shenzhenica TaxID=1088818 RepID=A0A2I0AA26_9ASPA|nr:Premnaspirodiene oxygenase [Apostasia shenzhenica]